jgi:DNA polymerase-3 subunit alpha
MPGFIREAEEMDIKIKPPDVNHGGLRFQPEDGGIRFGLAGVKNVGEGAAAAIIAEREANGPFTTLIDFCSRIGPQDLNKKVVESLARCGGLDACNMHRARLYNGVDFAITRAASTLKDQQAGQGSLFDLMDGGSGSSEIEADLPECDPWHESEMLAAERELLGIYMSGHPLSQLEPILKKYSINTISDIPNLADHTFTRIGGLASTVTKKVTKKKEMMAIVLLEDLETATEVLVWPETFRNYSAVLEEDATLLIGGEVSRRGDTLSFIAHEVYPLEDAPIHFAERLSLHVSCAQLEPSLEKVKSILRLHPGPISVVICLIFPDGKKVMVSTDQAFSVLPKIGLLHELEHELGENTVFVQTKQAPLKNGEPPKRKWEKRGNR